MRGQLKMTKTGASAVQTIGIATGVRFGSQGSPDEVTLTLTSHDAKNDDGGNIKQGVWMSADKAVELAAAILLSVWEISPGRVNDDARRFVDATFEAASHRGKMLRALQARDNDI